MKTQKITAIALCIMMIAMTITVRGEDGDPLSLPVEQTAKFLQTVITQPTTASIGGEWTIISLARSGLQVPQEYYDTYYRNLEDALIQSDGILSSRKYTEYSRAILALTALGRDPSNVAGYNLLEKLSDFDALLIQGINGPIFALIALDSGGYDIPQVSDGKTQTTRQRLIDEIISRQNEDGGFALGEGDSDPDITAMALQALAPYQKQDIVSTALDKSLAYLAESQDENGGYTSFTSQDEKTLESGVQVIIGLTAMGIDPETDPRFEKVLDNVLGYAMEDGGFRHLMGDTQPDLMSTEQAMCCMVAYQRFLKGESPIFQISSDHSQSHGFVDLVGHWAQEEVEALVQKGIVSGVTEQIFEPDRTMTRAEFATIVVKALELEPAEAAGFLDVPKDSWYAGYVGAAVHAGIVNGLSETEFAPDALITREEAAVMLARSGKYLGMDTAFTPEQTMEWIGQFEDYTKTWYWSRSSIAFCVKNGIISDQDTLIRAKDDITRAEAAVMIYRLLDAGKA